MSMHLRDFRSDKVAALIGRPHEEVVEHILNLWYQDCRKEDGHYFIGKVTLLMLADTYEGDVAQKLKEAAKDLEVDGIFG